MVDPELSLLHLVPRYQQHDVRLHWYLGGEEEGGGIK